MEDCIFCRIASGEIPSDIVYQNEDLVVFKDIHPAAPVHLLIVPRHHTTDILALSKEENGEATLGAILRALPDIARIAGVDQDGFRLINNCGPAGGQTIQHVHFHLIGGKTLGERLL